MKILKKIMTLGLILMLSSNLIAIDDQEDQDMSQEDIAAAVQEMMQNPEFMKQIQEATEAAEVAEEAAEEAENAIEAAEESQADEGSEEEESEESESEENIQE